MFKGRIPWITLQSHQFGFQGVRSVVLYFNELFFSSWVLGELVDDHAFHFQEFWIFLGLLFLNTYSILLIFILLNPPEGVILVWVLFCWLVRWLVGWFHTSPLFLTPSLFHGWGGGIYHTIHHRDSNCSEQISLSFHIPRNLGDCWFS